MVEKGLWYNVANVAAICTILNTLPIASPVVKKLWRKRKRKGQPMNAEASATSAGGTNAGQNVSASVTALEWVKLALSFLGVISAVYLISFFYWGTPATAKPVPPTGNSAKIALVNTNYEARFDTNPLSLTNLYSLVADSFNDWQPAYCARFYRAYLAATPDPNSRDQEPLYYAALLAMNPTADGYAQFHTNLDFMLFKIKKGDWNRGYSTLGFMVQNLGLMQGRLPASDPEQTHAADIIKQVEDIKEGMPH